MLNRKSPFTPTLFALLLAPVIGVADVDVDTSDWKCESCPFDDGYRAKVSAAQPTSARMTLFALAAPPVMTTKAAMPMSTARGDMSAMATVSTGRSKILASTHAYSLWRPVVRAASVCT